jgi:hypothetical protein
LNRKEIVRAPINPFGRGNHTALAARLAAPNDGYARAQRYESLHGD